MKPLNPQKSPSILSLSLSLSLCLSVSLSLSSEGGALSASLQLPAQVCSGATLFTGSSAALIKPWREAGGQAAADRRSPDMMWVLI